MNRRLCALSIASLLAIASCGGSDGDDATEAGETGDGASADADAAAPVEEPEEFVEQVPEELAADPGEAAADPGAGASDADAGTGVSGGPIADDWARVCELLDAQTVADLFGVEAASQVNGAGGGTGRCEYGAAGEVALNVTSAPEQTSMSAADAFAMRVGFERDNNGLAVAEAPLMGLPRASWIAPDGTAATIVALEPYLVEMTDVNGQDIVIGVALGSVLDALR